MANKTRPTTSSFDEYLKTIDNPSLKKEAKNLDAIFRRLTNQTPTIWGDSIVGYGRFHYKYPSGREGDWM